MKKGQKYPRTWKDAPYDSRSLEVQVTVKYIWEIGWLRHRELINLEFTWGIIMSGTFVVFTECKFLLYG